MILLTIVFPTTFNLQHLLPKVRFDPIHDDCASNDWLVYRVLDHG
jgi:hypothetical protein